MSSIIGAFLLRSLTAMLIGFLSVFAAAAGPARDDLLNADKPSLELVRKFAIEALSVIPGVSNVRPVGEDGVDIRNASGADLQIGLGNLLDSLTSAEPGERRHIVDRYAKFWATIASADDSIEQSVDRSAIIPLVRNIGMLQTLEEQADAAKREHPNVEQRWLTETFAGNLVTLLAINDESQITFLSNRQSDVLGLSDQQIWQLARANFRRIVAEPTVNMLTDTIGVVSYDREPSFNSSLILLTEFWDEVVDRMGPVVVIVPNRETLVFGRADRPEDIEALRKIGADQIGQPYPVSPGMYRYVKGTWNPLE